MAGEANLLRWLEPAVRPTGAPSPPTPARPSIERRSFDDLLQQAGRSPMPEPMQLSPAAQRRLDEFGVTLSEAQMQAIGAATDKAQVKGARNLLLVLEPMGFIVDVPGRTITTAINQPRLEEQVITRIDSAIFVSPPTESRFGRI